MALSDLILKGIDSADDAQLVRMHDKYAGEHKRNDLSPRDVEARTQILARIETVAASRGVNLGTVS